VQRTTSDLPLTVAFEALKTRFMASFGGKQNALHDGIRKTQLYRTYKKVVGMSRDHHQNPAIASGICSIRFKLVP